MDVLVCVCGLGRVGGDLAKNFVFILFHGVPVGERGQNFGLFMFHILSIFDLLLSKFNK